MSKKINLICKNIFKNLEKDAIKRAYNLSWIKIINEIEKSKGGNNCIAE